MTSRDLAECIGVSRTTVSNILNGKVSPSVNRIVEIARAIGVPVWRIFADPNENLLLLDEESRFRCPHCHRRVSINLGAMP